MADLGVFQGQSYNNRVVDPAQTSAVAAELRQGAQTVSSVLLSAPLRFAGSKTTLLGAGAHHGLLLIRSGFAFRCCVLADGRRAIVDLLVPGDIAGTDHLALSEPLGEIAAVSRVGYHALGRSEVDELGANRAALRYLLACTAEARWRSDRLSVMLGRLDAEARIAAFCLDIYDRLMRRGLATGLSFVLPLTQEQISDHLGLTLVHVNRTYRKMREADLVTISRDAVVIHDLHGIRELARGLPERELYAPELELPPLR